MLTDSLDELERILKALLCSLIVLPFLGWVVFQKWKIWTKLLERQLDKLSREVDDLQRHTQGKSEIVRELGDYIETVRGIVDWRRHLHRFLTIEEVGDMGTLVRITREMGKAIRESHDPMSGLMRYLETRRKTIGLIFNRMSGKLSPHDQARD